MFPRTVRETPFFRVGGTAYTYADWQQTDKRGKFEAALADATEQEIRSVADDLGAAKEKLEFLAKVLDEQMGEAAPDFVGSENKQNLGAAVRDCFKVAQLLLQRKTGGPEMADSTDSAPGTSAGVSVTTRNLANRAEAYRMLTQAADMLQQLEPHSPIPYFIR